MDELQSLSTSWPPGILHVEHFQVETATRSPARQQGFEVELQDSQVQIEVRADQTLLQALQAAGVDLPCNCGEGLCGACEVTVVQGEIDHRDSVLAPSERAAHQRMMACCSRAAGRKIVLAL